MILYLEKDCQHIAPDDLEERLLLKKERADKRKYNKQKLLQEREILLKNALKNVGLKLRPDSKLCQQFINNTLDKKVWNLEKVVKMCQEMNWLYTQTNYSELLDEALQDEIDFYKHEKGYFNFQDIYDYIEPKIRKKVKKQFNYLE